MSSDQLIREAAPEWRDDFRIFVETGDASPRLAVLMDENARCQQLVERAFEVQASDIKAAVVGFGGPGSRVPEAEPAKEPPIVIPHPAAISAWHRWQPYAAAAALVLAVASGLFVSGLSSIVGDQEMRLAELRREGADRLALVHSLTQERDQGLEAAASWERTAIANDGARQELQKSLEQQQDELAELRGKYYFAKRQLAAQEIIVASLSDDQQARSPGDSAPAQESWHMTTADYTPIDATPAAVLAAPPPATPVPTSTEAVDPAGAAAPVVAATSRPEVVQPRLLSDATPPRYPELAERHRIQGDVIIDCVVTIEGRTQNCEIAKSVPFLNQEALLFARNAVLEPGRIDGQPHPMPYQLRVSFELDAKSESGTATMASIGKMR